MTFRNFLQRCWFAKTELNKLAGPGCYFKNHFVHVSENPIKMSPSDHWFILIELHAWKIWVFKTVWNWQEKKNQHTKRRICWSSQVRVEICIAWRGEHRIREPPESWWPEQRRAETNGQHRSLTGIIRISSGLFRSHKIYGPWRTMLKHWQRQSNLTKVKKRWLEPLWKG